MTFFRSVAAAEDLLQEIFLGLSGFGARARLWIRRPRGRRTWIHSSAGKKSLDQRLRAPTHLAAGGAGNGSVQKRNGVVFRASVVGGEPAIPIDGYDLNALRRTKGMHIRVLRQLDGAVHKLRPDRRRRVRPFYLDIGVIVVADPYDRSEEHTSELQSLRH